MSGLLWDMAGLEGLQVAKAVFGEAVGYLAPFQSLETVLANEGCSVLRLCDRNFRIAYSGSLDQLIADQLTTPQPATTHPSLSKRNVWIRQYSWLSAIPLPAQKFQALTARATIRAPHRLAGLPNHQAVPAQLDNIAMLIWRHAPLAQPAIEIHAARADIEALIEKISHLS
ncbi:MAG: hypothetical protein WBD47_01955 [Phormidesmis sp.]